MYTCRFDTCRRYRAWDTTWASQAYRPWWLTLPVLVTSSSQRDKRSS